MVLRASAIETMIFPLSAALLCVFTRCSHHTSCSPLSLSYKGENKSAVNLRSAPLEMESCLSILTRSREQSCTYMLSWQRLQVLSSSSVDKILGAQCYCLFNYCYYLVRLGQQFKCNWHKGFAKLITRSACNNFCVSLALPGENNPRKTSWKKG